MNRKPIFAALRRALGRGLSQSEVEAMDEAIEASMRPDAPSEPETAFTPASLGADGQQLIKSFEGCARKLPSGLIESYPDPGTGGDPWTIGWGTTRIDGQKVRPGMKITQGQADSLLLDDLEKYARDVIAALGSAIEATSQLQFDALVSFHYNTGAIRSATLTRKHKAGDFAGAAKEFARWNKAGGRVMAGLTRRRAAEAALYRRGS